jgi:hypothetical protein
MTDEYEGELIATPSSPLLVTVDFTVLIDRLGSYTNALNALREIRKAIEE